MKSKIGAAEEVPCGVYVHIPYCKAKCAYCAFVSGCDFSSQEQYVNALLREIGELRGKDIVADTVYIGGGTPSCLYNGAIKAVIDALRNNITVDDDAEITVEANPESCDESFVDEIKAAGVNRVSLGLQSADDRILASIGRIHTCADFLKAVGILKSRGIDNISSDIILGLPGDGVDNAVKAISILSGLCSHISVYALTVEDGTPLCKSGYVPDDDNVADMYATACDALRRNGFSRYEVSNFARYGMESRHNRKYWTMKPYIGLGAAAHGYDGGKTRFVHSDDIMKYIAGEHVSKVALTDRDVHNEYVMLALRTERGIDRHDFLRRFGYDFYSRNFRVVDMYKNMNAVIVDDDYVRIAPDKMFVMNGIIEDFLID